MSEQFDRPRREGRSWQRNAVYWTIIVGGFLFVSWQVARFFDWPQPGWLDELAEESWEELMARGRAAFNAARFNEARRCFAGNAT